MSQQKALIKLLPLLLLGFSIAVTGHAQSSNTIVPPLEKYPGTARVLAHIREAIPQTVRVQKKDNGNYLGVPCPFTSPCVNDTFVLLFYWDSYFMNLGMLRNGMEAQAKNNADDLLYLVDEFGFVPCMSLRTEVNRSQTPFLALMVRDVFAATGDREWLKRAYPTVAKEYHFWMTQRLTPTGLNRQYNSATTNYLMSFYAYLEGVRLKGVKLTNQQDKLAFSSQALSESETWDFNPRFDRRAEDFCPVDINANLYLYETILGDFSKVLNNGEESAWREKAAKRKKLFQKYLWNDKLGCYTDYDFKKGRKGEVVSCATLFPLMAGIATPGQAKKVVNKMKAVLECDHGLAACQKRPEKFVYQWDYPNAWPPLQVVAIQALDRYGFKADARRIGEKYVRTVIVNYDKTGNLWEKYNAMTGSIDVANEYKMPPMVGWTAGVFVFTTQYLDHLTPYEANTAR